MNLYISYEINTFSKLGINAFRIINTQINELEKYNKLLEIAQNNNHIISYSNQTENFLFLKNVSVKYPNLRIVIENIGNIYNDKKTFDVKLNQLCELSSNKNIYVHVISFLVEYAIPKFFNCLNNWSYIKRIK